MLDKGSDILKKMPTLFVREFEDHQVKRVLNEVPPDCLWVINKEGYATEKLDGTCCMIKDNKIYKRFDFKKGRTLPKKAIPCQKEPDPITQKRLFGNSEQLVRHVLERIERLLVAIDAQDTLIAPAPHAHTNHAKEPDDAKQVVDMPMGHKDLVDALPDEVGMTHLRDDS